MQYIITLRFNNNETLVVGPFHDIESLNEWDRNFWSSFRRKYYGTKNPPKLTSKVHDYNPNSSAPLPEEILGKLEHIQE